MKNVVLPADTFVVINKTVLTEQDRKIITINYFRIDKDNLRKEINNVISDTIGPIAKLDKIQFTSGLPKTRSGKIMRRILRKIASKEIDNLGDTSTLLNPEIVQEIIDNAL